jgi:hypothetical protein
MSVWSSPLADGVDGEAASRSERGAHAPDDRVSAPPAVPGADDPLAAFLDGLHGLSSHGAPVGPPAASGPAVVLLSNGLNADGGVAQLVSALASVHDGNAAFNASPFAASRDAGVDGVVAVTDGRIGRDL